MDVLLADLRYAARTLSRSRGFTIVALACVALGIGATTAMFSVVHAVLFRPLPFAEPQRLVAIHAANEARDVEEGELTYPDLADLRATGAFAAVEGQDDRTYTLTDGEVAESVAGAAVTPGLFGMLGIRPQHGRLFVPADAAAPGFEGALLLGDDLWRNRFGADPDIVGRTVRLNGREIVVAGVMPPGFRFPEHQQVWLPLGAADALSRQGRYVRVLARLAEGVTAAEAGTRVRDLSTRLASAHPDSHEGWTAGVVPLRDEFVDRRGQRLMAVMLGAVAFVLLIACANVANLQLARGADRQREIAVRTALGASRARIARQLVTESLLLALAGGVLGTVLAVWWNDALLRAIPEELDYWIRVRLDGAVLLFTAVTCALAGLLFGLYPALHATRPDLQRDLKDGSRSAGDVRTGRIRGALVVGEIALSLVLLVGASLMIRSFLRLQAADPGFDVAPMFSARLNIAGDRYDGVGARARLHETAAARLRALPGVAGAASVSAIPADDGGPVVSVRAAGSDRSDDEGIFAMRFAASTGFFDALDVDLLAGRDFTAAEVLDTAAAVAIVSRALAHRLWPDGDAIGRTLVLGTGEARDEVIVTGIAPDLFYEEFGEETPAARLQVHLPYGRVPVRQTAFLVRARDGDAAALAGAVRSEIRAIDGNLAPFDMLTMTDRRRVTTWEQRLFGQLFGVFGAIALGLAVAGVYGVMTYLVGRRRREIGIRMAVGAKPADVAALVLGNAGRLALAGIALGILGALALARLLEALLYDVSTADPVTFVAGAAVLAGAALLSSWLPARRAVRISPIEALRAD